MKNKLKTKDFRKLLKSESIRVEYVTTKCDIKPSIQESAGQGAPNIWSLGDGFKIYLAHETNRMGVPTKNIRMILEELEKYEAENKVGLWGPAPLKETIKLHFMKTSAGSVCASLSTCSRGSMV